MEMEKNAEDSGAKATAVPDENPIKKCWYCKKDFDGDFEIMDFEIICPFCKRPQSSVFEEESQKEIIKKSKEGINRSKKAMY